MQKRKIEMLCLRVQVSSQWHAVVLCSLKPTGIRGHEMGAAYFWFYFILSQTHQVSTKSSFGKKATLSPPNPRRVRSSWVLPSVHAPSDFLAAYLFLGRAL